MSEPFYDDEDEGYVPGNMEPCPDCAGDGMKIICWDDICRGSFDGEGPPCGNWDCVRQCPTCKGPII